MGDDTMWCVCWKIASDEVKRSAKMRKVVADAWVADLNKRWPELRHWAEPVPDEPAERPETLPAAHGTYEDGGIFPSEPGQETT
jgi:hypothetical protein